MSSRVSFSRRVSERGRAYFVDIYLNAHKGQGAELWLQVLEGWIRNRGDHW